MNDATPSSTQIQLRLNRLQAGDESARDELLQIACERLTRLARKMLRSYPVVRPWEQTDVVCSPKTGPPEMRVPGTLCPGGAHEEATDRRRGGAIAP